MIHRSASKFKSYRIGALALAIAAALGTVLVAPEALSQTTHAKSRIEIAAGPAGQTLKQFVDQTGMQLLFDFEAVNQLSTQSVSGEFNAVEALTRMLDGTGLGFEFVNERTVTVTAKDDNRRKNRIGRLGDFPDGLVIAQATGGDAAPAAGAYENHEDSPSLEEVVVTAQRREESLQDVPISISVLSGQKLDATTTAGLADALRSVPGFDADRRDNTSYFSLRGVSSGSYGMSGTLGLYFDGVPFALVRQSFYPNPNVYDLDRIEVLQGPQGTLYGANSLNGVIRMLTKDANADQFEFKMRTLISTTEDGAQSTGSDAAVNVPLIDGRLGARFVVGFNNAGGWLDAPGRRDSNGFTTADYRFKLHGQPSDTLSMDLSVWREETDRNQSDLGFDDRTIADRLPTQQFAEFTTYGLNIRKDFASFALTSQTSFIDYKNEASASGEPFDFPARDFGTKKSAIFSQEINAISNLEGPWQWSAGVFYRDGIETELYHLEFPLDTPPALFEDYDDRSESYAVYGEVSRDLGEFNFAVGLRYFHEEETMTVRLR